METLTTHDERLDRQINLFRARIFSYFDSLKDRTAFKNFYGYYFPTLEHLMTGEKDAGHFCVTIENFNKAGISDIPATSGIIEIIREVFEIEPISKIPAKEEGHADFTAYKTNLPRIFVTHSFLRKHNGSSSAWSFERVDPGTEEQYSWLPKDYEFATS